MLVRSSESVDVSGKCDPVYIQNWRRKSEGCNLESLLQELKSQFSREPPVYSKPVVSTSPKTQSPPSPSRPQSTDYSNRPPPIPPNHPRMPVYPKEPSAVHSSDTGTISPPPRPVIPQGPPSSVSYPAGVLPHQRPDPPQVTYHSGPPASQQPPRYHTAQANPPPPPTAISPPPPPIHSATPAQSPSQLAQQWMTVPYTSPPPPVHPPSAPLPHASSLSLLDADETLSAIPSPAAAPPRPPNPELLSLHGRIYTKFTTELTSLSHALSADTQRLRTTQDDLLRGEPAIRDESARLEAVRDVCVGVAGRYKETIARTEANLVELKRKGDPEVDELICASTIVHNQLIDLVAEDNAIEDTIYHLHRALNAGRIDLDKFLRTTRSLAEEQFMRRALAEKITASIPMGVSLGWS